MDNCAINIQNLTKEYKLYESEMDRFKESFSLLKKSYHRKFYALKNVDIKIGKGEKVGIIGSNGAGKSTLLKIVTEVLEPTEGRVEINGRVAALLELGAGFNQEYTGLENIRLSGMLMGYSPKEMEEKTRQIIEFADIGEFIDQPVKTYSSGMFVRLAFATQIFSSPDILIVDEALSVGDIRFQQKCYRAMDSLMKDKTVVLVTHDTAAVTRFCNRVIWMNQGEKFFDGEVVEGLNLYQEYLINQSINEGTSEDKKNENTIDEKRGTMLELPLVPPNIKIMGNGEATITHCGLLDERKRLIDTVEPGQTVDIVSRIRFNRKVARPLYGITVRDRLGNDIVALNSETIGEALPSASGEKEYHLQFKIPEINKGRYVISVAVASGTQLEHVQLCWLNDMIVFQVPDRTYDVPGFLYVSDGKIEIVGIEK